MELDHVGTVVDVWLSACMTCSATYLHTPTAGTNGLLKATVSLTPYALPEVTSTDMLPIWFTIAVFTGTFVIASDVVVNLMFKGCRVTL